MSVVVWDGRYLCADRAINDGHTVYPLDKIVEIYRGTTWACCVGPIHRTSRIMAYYMGRAPHGFCVTEFNEVRMVIANHATGLIRMLGPGQFINHGYSPCAFGDASDFAYGALAMGATAEQAVIAAQKYSATSGHGVQVVEVGRG